MLAKPPLTSTNATVISKNSNPKISTEPAIKQPTPTTFHTPIMLNTKDQLSTTYSKKDVLQYKLSNLTDSPWPHTLKSTVFTMESIQPYPHTNKPNKLTDKMSPDITQFLTTPPKNKNSQSITKISKILVAKITLLKIKKLLEFPMINYVNNVNTL